MKHILPILITIISINLALGQTDKVQGKLSSLDTADLTILNIYPDSFPTVSVVFKAETRKGEPVWNLTKEKMKVKENALNCNVISLEQISKKKAINIGVVIDHSGSMQMDKTLLFDSMGQPLFSYDINGQFVLPKGYLPPIENAKSAVKKFVTSFNTKKDFISVIGFSRIVDKRLALTQNIGQINTIVESMQADFNTALYDAMISGVDEIKKADGIKVLVVLTDGGDNASEAKWNDVIEKANKEEIPVYIIGIGDVNIDTLKLIAKATHGEFYYTKSSSSLDSVYSKISKQVQAFYNLVYRSQNFSSTDTTRQVELSFEMDHMIIETGSIKTSVPKEVLLFLENKEKEKEYIFYGGIGLATIVVAGTILYFYRRRKQNLKPVIKNLFPNPTFGQITIEYENGIGQLQILNISGKTEKVIEINGTETTFDLTDLQAGVYLAVINANGQVSNSSKFIIQK